MEETQVCCCGASGWTKVIAWFQIMGSAIQMLPLFFILFTSSYIDAAEGDPEIELSEQPESILILKLMLNATIAGIVFFLLLVSLSFVMGIVLLRGSHNKNPGDIFAWMIYGVIGVVIWTLLFFFQCVVSPSGVGIVFNVIVLTIQVFCLWVVGKHKDEIEAATLPGYNRLNPIKAYGNAF